MLAHADTGLAEGGSCDSSVIDPLLVGFNKLRILPLFGQA